MKNKALPNDTLSTPTGRFAPSPSGELHLGSLIAATASYLNAKKQQGRWLVRIDDIDGLRVKAGSEAAILQTLADFGFEWDQLIRQSERLPAYQDAINGLIHTGYAYYCDCSRSAVLSRTNRIGYYDNYCRHRKLTPKKQHSIRVITPNGNWSWQDEIQLTQQTDWQAALGDFIIQRSDGVIAYHLACAIDDSDFGITEVVRGADLLDASTPQQYLQHLLQRPTPHYAHHPLLFDAQSGIKLSKASHAQPLDKNKATALLCEVLRFLGQKPPTDCDQNSLSDCWLWAKQHWDIKNVPSSRTKLTGN